MMGMAQRMPQRPQMGPSPMTAGRPNPMAGFQGAGGGFKGGPQPVGPQGMFGGGGGFKGGPPPMGPQGMPGFQGTGQLGPMGPQGPMGGAQGPPPGWHGGQSTPMMGQIVGGGQQGMSDAMMHPFAPRNLDAMQGAMGGGANMRGLMQNALGGMQGAMGGGPQPSPWGGANMIQPAVRQMQGAMGPGFQRRFPGALSRGIMQGMAPPPQAPPAPYGGQQFRMW